MFDQVYWQIAIGVMYLQVGDTFGINVGSHYSILLVMWLDWIQVEVEVYYLYQKSPLPWELFYTDLG